MERRKLLNLVQRRHCESHAEAWIAITISVLKISYDLQLEMVVLHFHALGCWNLDIDHIKVIPRSENQSMIPGKGIIAPKDVAEMNQVVEFISCEKCRTIIYL